MILFSDMKSHLKWLKQQGKTIVNTITPLMLAITDKDMDT